MADIKSEFELIQDSYLKVWAIFITWFTWFVNINLLAVGWIITADAGKKPGGAFVVLMELLIATGFGATICIAIYTRHCHSRAEQLLTEGKPAGYLLGSILPSSITNYAPIAMAIALVIVGVMWYWVYAFK